MNKHKKYIHFLVTVFVIFGLAGVSLAAVKKTAPKKVAPKNTTPAPILVGRRDLNGDFRPFSTIYAVAVDNMPVARPQSGINSASLVIEAPVEGGITRFLAFFSDAQDIVKIGPVRSARPYFIDWMLEYNAMFVHVGGSPEALKMLKKIPSRDLNEIKSGQFFYRDKARRAPHNAYTTLPNLMSAARKVKYASASLTDRTFDVVVPSGGKSGKKLMVDFSFPSFKTQWTYDLKTKSYKRVQGQKTTNIAAKNVIVQVVDTKVLDDIGRLSIKTSGTGPSVFLRNGQSFKGTWEKIPGSLTRFLDGFGREIPLDPGNTWIEVVPSVGSKYLVE